MVLVDSNVMPVPETTEANVANVVTGLKTDSYKDVARAFVPPAMFNERSDQAMKEDLLAGMLQTPQRVMYSALASLFKETHTHEGPMPVPTLVLRAATFRNSPEELQARFPNIELQEIDAAHFLQLERPEEVNKAIRGFIVCFAFRSADGGAQDRS